MDKKSHSPRVRIDERILRLRGHNVMRDVDLAGLYGVETKVLNQAVRRNAERFPSDFMFQLTVDELKGLRSHFVTLDTGRGSTRAVRVNIEIMRAFVRLRRLVESHETLARKLDALEAKYDAQFAVVFEAIRELMAPPPSPKKRIGFRSGHGGPA